MGDWHISIQGVGPHGNGIPQDAEQLFKKFIEELRANGHNLVNQSITSGGAYHYAETIPPVKEKQDWDRGK